MKTRFLIISACAVTLVALFACNKEQEVVNEEPKTIIEEPAANTGIPFEFVAGTPGTKTVNEGMSTTWASSDKISLFHAETGETTYVNDGQFDASAAGASVPFTGTLAAELTADNYDWYAIYPYVATNTTPANSGSTGFITVGCASNGVQTQTGNNSKAHLAGSNYPVAGFVKNVAKATKPVIAMTQLTSVVAIEVTNSTGAPITVNDISFTAPESIVGTYYINFSDTPVEFTQSGPSYVSTTAKLHVDSGETIAADDKATFYLAIKPFTATAGSTLTMAVNASNGKQSKTSSALGSDFSFVAGKIHKLTFSYTKAVVSTESVAYETGFENGEGFTATASYNNTSVKFQGPAASTWGVLSGSTSETSKIAGSQSMMLRDYTANAFMPYVYTDFKLSSVKEVRFKAKNAVDGYNLVLSYSSDLVNWTDAQTFTLSDTSDDYSYVFPTTQNNIALKFTVSATSRTNKKDVWIDDVSISKTALEPTVSVSTSAATNLATVAGTTATLNGSLTLLYGATIGNLTKAGFYYKASEAGSFTKVECDPAPAAEGAFTYNLTGLTANTEYIYYAYAIYSGSEITDEANALTFTPLQAVTATINFGSAAGSTKIEGKSPSGTGTVTYTDTGNDDQGNTWTITTVTSNDKSFTQNASYSQVGASNKGVSSITITTTLPASKEITAMSAKVGGFSGTAGTVNLKVGTTTIGTGNLNAATDVVVSNTKTESGTVLTVTITPSSNKGVKVYYVSATYK